MVSLFELTLNNISEEAKSLMQCAQNLLNILFSDVQKISFTV